VQVSVDGEPRGVTPLDVKVQRGTQPMTIELRANGFQTQTQDVIPDKDQRLYVALLPVSKKPTRHPPHGQGSGSGFKRFD
jgi:hypothetical protein